MPKSVALTALYSLLPVPESPEPRPNPARAQLLVSHVRHRPMPACNSGHLCRKLCGLRDSGTGDARLATKWDIYASILRDRLAAGICEGFPLGKDLSCSRLSSYARRGHQKIDKQGCRRKIDAMTMRINQ